jgi:hypothetical protein
MNSQDDSAEVNPLSPCVPCIPQNGLNFTLIHKSETSTVSFPLLP